MSDDYTNVSFPSIHRSMKDRLSSRPVFRVFLWTPRPCSHLPLSPPSATVTSDLAHIPTILLALLEFANVVAERSAAGLRDDPTGPRLITLSCILTRRDLGLGLKLTFKHFDTKLSYFLQSLPASKLSLAMLGDVVSTSVMGLATTREAVAVTARMISVNFMVTKLLSLLYRFFDLFSKWAVGSCEIQGLGSRGIMEERRGMWWWGRRFNMGRGGRD